MKLRKELTQECPRKYKYKADGNTKDSPGLEKQNSIKVKKKKEKIQINRNRNEQGNNTIHTKEIQNIIREYFQNLYSIKLENLKEINF